MLRRDLKRLASLLAVAALFWSVAGTAVAVGTDAGTNISNTATVDYTVNAVAQPQLESNAVEFLVDRMVDLTVTPDIGTEVIVTPNTNGAFLFTVSNTSNAELGFDLAALNAATNPFAPPADNFDPSTLNAFVDAGTLGTYEPLVDVDTTIDNLLEDDSIGVWVVAGIPGGQADDDVAAVTLTATAREPGVAGAPLTEEANPENPAVMETVFGDGAGPDDNPNAADFSARGAFLVQSATITIVKTETLISDPVNGNAPNARHIPGAIVEYVVTVTNDAGSTLSATALTILDVLPSDVTFEADTYATGKGIKLGAVAQTNIVDGDQGSESAGTVTVTVASLAPAASAVITYRVSVD
jgi:uncharacterized repeat protein (TIGR01451 family)